jgi:hypothetical protein
MNVIPAKAGIQNSLNTAPGGTGFRGALRLPGMRISSFVSIQRFEKER